MANYCFPRSWPSPAEVSRLPASVRVSIGVHPRNAQSISTAMLDRMKGLLALEKVVAVGEIGLDFTGSSRDTKTLQVGVLGTVLSWAVARSLPIIIHCRDEGDGSASTECLKVLREHVPRFWAINRHCFSEGIAEATRWLQDFPNTLFGLTTTLLREDRHPGMDIFVRSTRMECLLLESDAPYLPPPLFPRGTLMHPWMMEATAARVAQLKGVPINTVYEATRKAAQRFYNHSKPFF